MLALAPEASSKFLPIRVHGDCIGSLFQGVRGPYLRATTRIVHGPCLRAVRDSMGSCYWGCYGSLFNKGLLGSTEGALVFRPEMNGLQALVQVLGWPKALHWYRAWEAQVLRPASGGSSEGGSLQKGYIKPMRK